MKPEGQTRSASHEAESARGLGRALRHVALIAVTVSYSCLATSVSAQFRLDTRRSALANPYLFQGARYDAETAFYYSRNRYYDSGTGRFLQRDPVWDQENVGGAYTFVGNSPISGDDALGLDEGGKKFRRWTGRSPWPKPRKFARYTPTLGRPLWPYFPAPASRDDYDEEKHGPITIEMELRWGRIKPSDLDPKKVTKEEVERWVAAGCATPDDFPHVLLGPPGEKRWAPLKRVLRDKQLKLIRELAEFAKEHAEASVQYYDAKPSRPSPIPSVDEERYWKFKMESAEHWMKVREAQIRDLQDEIDEICNIQATEEGGLRSGLGLKPGQDIGDVDIESDEGGIEP